MHIFMFTRTCIHLCSYTIVNIQTNFISFQIHPHMPSSNTVTTSDPWRLLISSQFKQLYKLMFLYINLVNDACQIVTLSQDIRGHKNKGNGRQYQGSLQRRNSQVGQPGTKPCMLCSSSPSVQNPILSSHALQEPTVIFSSLAKSK